MLFKSESLPSQFIHTLTEIKLKDDDPLKIWFSAIDWIPIHNKCFHLYSDIGAPAFNPVSMFKALLLIYLGQAESERDIGQKLQFDVRLQSLCGFDFFDTPSHVSFHNFRLRLGTGLFYDILHQLIAQAIAVGVIKNFINTAIDATHFWAYSNKFGVKVCQCKDKCQCLKKYSDPDAKWGYKSKEYAFLGYKVHLIVDVQSQIPIEAIITSGEVHDSQQANELLNKAKEKHPEISIYSSAMDAAYDDTDIYKNCLQQDVHPIIALNSRHQDKYSQVNQQVSIDNNGNWFCCKTKIRLVKNGTDPKRKNRLKLICSPTDKRKNCPFRQTCCPNSKVGRTFYIYPLKDVRLFGTIPRDSNEWKFLYSQRTAVERTNSQLKSPTHKLDEPRVRGMEQIQIHIYLSICALIIKTIGRKKQRL